jgi:hypothetical protein
MHLVADDLKGRANISTPDAPRQFVIFLLCLALAGVLSPTAVGAKAKPKPEPAAPEATHGALPADLNLASLRVSAMDTIYELDLSIDQIRSLRALAVGAASTESRKPAKADPKLAAALQEMENALLDGKDDQAIAKARSQVIELFGAVEPPLDDDIHVTAAARSKAAGYFARIKASQVAAFLATHADEVGDPVEMMTDALTTLRANRTKEAGGSNVEAAEEAAITIQEISEKVSALVAGTDEARDKEVADQVAAWLNTNYELSDDAYASKQAAMEAAAVKIVGDVSNMSLLQHWLENQIAILLSNPQLAFALDAIQAGRL